MAYIEFSISCGLPVETAVRKPLLVMWLSGTQYPIQKFVQDGQYQTPKDTTERLEWTWHMKDTMKNHIRFVVDIYGQYETLEHTVRYRHLGRWSLPISDLPKGLKVKMQPIRLELDGAKPTVTGHIKYLEIRENTMCGKGAGFFYLEEREKNIVREHDVLQRQFVSKIYSHSDSATSEFVKQMHLPRFFITEQVRLLGSTAILVESIQPQLRKKHLDIYNCLLKVVLLNNGWTEEHFVRIAKKPLDSNFYWVLSMIGAFFTSLLFDYGADLDFKGEKDVEEFKLQIRKFSGAGDCEDGTLDIWAFVMSIKKLPKDALAEYPLLLAVWRILLHYCPAVTTGVAATGNRLEDVKQLKRESGGGRHATLTEKSSTCHVWAMLVPLWWLQEIKVVEANKEFQYLKVPFMILETTNLCYALPRPIYRMTQPEGDFKRAEAFVIRYQEFKIEFMANLLMSNKEGYVGMLMPEAEGDVDFYHYITHWWMRLPGHENTLDWLVGYKKPDGTFAYGLDFTDAIFTNTKGIDNGWQVALEPVSTLTQKQIEDAKTILYSHISLLGQWDTFEMKLLSGKYPQESDQIPPDQYGYESKLPFPSGCKCSCTYQVNVSIEHFPLSVHSRYYAIRR